MESVTTWIRLFHIVFVMVSLTTGTGEGLVLSYSLILASAYTFI